MRASFCIYRMEDCANSPSAQLKLLDPLCLLQQSNLHQPLCISEHKSIFPKAQAKWTLEV